MLTKQGIVIVALTILVPTLAVAQEVTHEQIEQAYGKCARAPSFRAPNVRPLNRAADVPPTWDDPDLAQICPKIWAKWKAHKEELESQKTKDDLKAFADKLR